MSDENAIVEGGFTLVELLVSLIILGFISVMLMVSTRFGIAAWHRSEAFDATAGEFVLTRRMLVQRIGEAYPRYDMPDLTRHYAAFAGSSDHLELLSEAPDNWGRSGFAEYQLDVTGNAGHRALTITASREQAWSDIPTPEPSLLVDGADDVEFAYFGRDAGGSLGWQNTWIERPTLPDLVRIQIRFPAEDRREWPDLIVAPRIAEDTNCVYDSLSKGCRGR